MKKYLLLFLTTIISLFFMPSICNGQAWKELTTVEQVYSDYPDRVCDLLEAVNMDYSGLEEVRNAFYSSDTLLAATELLDYYKKKTKQDTILPQESVANNKESQGNKTSL